MNFCNIISMNYTDCKGSLEEVQSTINFIDESNLKYEDSYEEALSTINFIDNDLSQVCK